MKPKAKTMQERFGFKDEELTTPAHDEIMLWLDANIGSIVADLIPQKWTEHDLKSQQHQLKRAYSAWLEKVAYKVGSGTIDAGHLRALKANLENARSKNELDEEHEGTRRLDDFLLAHDSAFPDPGPVPPPPPSEVVRRKWEFPILDRTYTVGFADFLAMVRQPRAHLVGAEPVETTFAPHWAISNEPINLLFEVKPTIRSLGELIRQINFYREYEQQGNFYVVSPDDRFRAILESQGIHFVKYPAPSSD